VHLVGSLCTFCKLIVIWTIHPHFLKIHIETTHQPTLRPTKLSALFRCSDCNSARIPGISNTRGTVLITVYVLCYFPQIHSPLQGLSRWNSETVVWHLFLFTQFGMDSRMLLCIPSLFLTQAKRWQWQNKVSRKNCIVAPNARYFRRKFHCLYEHILS
jgi:hypothetical protein